jgi:hypothetical protein
MIAPYHSIESLLVLARLESYKASNHIQSTNGLNRLVFESRAIRHLCCKQCGQLAPEAESKTSKNPRKFEVLCFLLLMLSRGTMIELVSGEFGN